MPNKPPHLPTIREDDAPRRKRASRQARGYTDQHLADVAALLRERPLCEVRGERCTGWATEGHHLKYPAESLADYVAVCRACHIEIERRKNT